MKTKIIGAVEIGTAKTVVLIGEIQKNKTLNLVGFSEIASKGVRKGSLIDFENCSKSTHEALAAAEKSADTEIETIYLAQTGSHLQGFFNTAATTVSASNNLVNKSDIKTIIENSKRKELPADRVYIHHIQNAFKLDDRYTKNPLRMEGSKLEVGYWSIHANIHKLRDHIHVVNSFGLKVEDVILSSIASGSIVAHESEKQNGILVVDIGCGTTDYVLYKDGYILRTGIIPIGGDHLTNDLSLGLRISYVEAEALKLQYGKAVVDNQTKDEVVLLGKAEDMGSRYIFKGALYQILQARIVELFEVLKQQLEPFLNAQFLPGGILLTGGVSKLSGIEKAASMATQLTVRQAQHPAWVSKPLQGPEYTTVLGVLQYAFNGQSFDATSPNLSIKERVLRLFK
jgi:cell division protein FtsA